LKRILVKYSKQGEMAFLSHRETMRCLERALRRSSLPLAYTSGFNPRPRISYSPALPLGVAAEADYLEVSLEDGAVNAGEAIAEMNRALPEGLRVAEIQAMAPNIPRLSRWSRYGLYRVSDGHAQAFLLLSMSGEKQGRLRDALAKMPLGGAGRRYEVTRVGLFASRDEVLEEVDGEVYYYDGETGELRDLRDEEAASGEGRSGSCGA
jgi:hypothetical protein